MAVKVARNAKYDKEYTFPESRIKNDGMIGKIVEHHDSHGLCFVVDGGATRATWEPDELTVVDPEQTQDEETTELPPDVVEKMAASTW